MFFVRSPTHRPRNLTHRQVRVIVSQTSDRQKNTNLASNVQYGTLIVATQYSRPPLQYALTECPAVISSFIVVEDTVGGGKEKYARVSRWNVAVLADAVDDSPSLASDIQWVCCGRHGEGGAHQ